MRRPIRNLLSNARRYEGESTVEVEVRGASHNAKASDVDGVGLGLAIVRRIARLHGTQVRCVPRPGGGARFEVELGEGNTLETRCWKATDAAFQRR